MMRCKYCGGTCCVAYLRVLKIVPYDTETEEFDFGNVIDENIINDDYKDECADCGGEMEEVE